MGLCSPTVNRFYAPILVWNNLVARLKGIHQRLFVVPLLRLQAKEVFLTETMASVRIVVSYILAFTFKMTSLFIFNSFVSDDVTIAKVFIDKLKLK